METHLKVIMVTIDQSHWRILVLSLVFTRRKHKHKDLDRRSNKKIQRSVQRKHRHKPKHKRKTGPKTKDISKENHFALSFKVIK